MESVEMIKVLNFEGNETLAEIPREEAKEIVNEGEAKFVSSIYAQITKSDADIRKFVRERDGYTCQICGAEGKSVIKKIPEGLRIPSNLQCACQSCAGTVALKNKTEALPSSSYKAWYKAYSREKIGKSFFGFLIEDANGKVVAKKVVVIKRVDLNIAERFALKALLEYLHKNKIRDVIVLSNQQSYLYTSLKRVLALKKEERENHKSKLLVEIANLYSKTKNVKHVKLYDTNVHLVSMLQQEIKKAERTYSAETSK